MRKPTLVSSMFVLLILAVAGIISHAETQVTPQSINSGQHFLPPYTSVRDRFGFDANESMAGYDMALLHAGWYSNWGANRNPPHPDQLAYPQLVRFHAGADPSDPNQVSVHPNMATIAQIAAKHPGSLWLMSNEPDSIYQGDPILPATYAHAYHKYYHYVKELDPTAIVANGGIVQPTPCRLEYLDVVLDTYQAAYGEPMPVDVWNIHAFVLREVGTWGASTPPGIDPSCGIDYTMDDGGDISIFWDNVKAMRAWMKERGYQDRPLIISEYGILWPERVAAQYTPQRVGQFMVQTFDLFLYDTDPEIGYPADEHRLVQAWAWYSLTDQYFNGYLFYPDSKELSPIGEAYANYTAALSDTLQADLSARLLISAPGFTTTLTGTAATPTFTVVLTGSIGNLGKLPVTDVLARLEIVSAGGGTVLVGHDALYDVPARFDGVVIMPPMTATLAAPEDYHLRLSLDPEGQIQELRKWNNVATQTLGVRPDLVPLALTYQLDGPVVHSGTLTLTATVGNQGNSPSPTVVSATVYLETMAQGTLGLPSAFSVPPLGIGEQASVSVNLAWPTPEQDFYRLILNVDEPDQLIEQNEANNTLETLLPVTLQVTLTPTATTVLTAASGSLHMIFPSGLVTMPTKVIYTPLWPADWVQGGLNWSTEAFSLLALLGDQPQPLVFDEPFFVTWHYNESDLNGVQEAQLRAFVLNLGGHWAEAGCQPYQRDLAQDQLTSALCRAGVFVFGNRYELYLPHAFNQGTIQEMYAEPSWDASQDDRPGSTLRLP